MRLCSGTSIQYVDQLYFLIADCFRPDKYIETSEHGLVIIAVTEADAGRYDCWMGASLLCSYNVTVDAHRCAPPAKSNDYQKIYSDWCHEFEKYKSAMKTWERKQAVSWSLNRALIFYKKTFDHITNYCSFMTSLMQIFRTSSLGSQLFNCFHYYYILLKDICFCPIKNKLLF